MKKSIEVHDLSCGATLVAERVDATASCALKWLLPAGSSMDPPDSVGVSAMLEELIFRGAGKLDARALSDAMDCCGLQRHTDVGIHHLHVSGVCTGRELDRSIDLLASIVCHPHLPEEALEPIRSLCLQELEALQDEPKTEVMLQLREQHRRSPFNRSGYGERGALERISIDALQQAWRAFMVPEGSIISLAGDIDIEHVLDRFETTLAGWQGAAAQPAAITPAGRGTLHEVRESNQSHIALAWDAPMASDPDALLERVANRVLSGSASGRLFTEVRQKRSLCYAVGASYRAGRDEGVISLYAGTTPDRAQETLDVCLKEFDRMDDGIKGDEFNRAILGLESDVVLGGESTSARASALAVDWFTLGRVRTLGEVIDELRGVTLDDVNDYLARRTPGSPTLVTMGPPPPRC